MLYPSYLTPENKVYPLILTEYLDSPPTAAIITTEAALIFVFLSTDISPLPPQSRFPFVGTCRATRRGNIDAIANATEGRDEIRLLKK